MRVLAIAILLLAVPTVPADGGIHIVELLAEPDDGREFIELHNTGPAQDLAGWSIEDAAANRFTFTNQHLPQGSRIVVWGGGVATPEGPAWSMASVWNNAGDTATLRNAEGDVVHTFSYPVAERAQRGAAYVWDGTWTTGTPSPGRAPGSQGGSATATVVDAPPEPWIDAPDTGEGAVQIAFGAMDPNGDSFAWTFHAGDALLANGTGDVHRNLVLDVTETQVLRLVAGNTSVEHTLYLAPPALEIELPAGGLRFPALTPGALDVQVEAPFRLHNHGSTPLDVHIDVSDFHGPDRFAVAGLLEIGRNGTWVSYDGPLTLLPAIPPGSHDIWLRLAHVPVPLAAGTYGTSFAVVA